jgi:hypothetical protein
MRTSSSRPRARPMIGWIAPSERWVVWATIQSVVRLPRKVSHLANPSVSCFLAQEIGAHIASCSWWPIGWFMCSTSAMDLAFRCLLRKNEFFPTRASQRYIPMLLRRILIALGVEHLQRLDELFAGVARLDGRVQEAALGGDLGIGKVVAELFYFRKSAPDHLSDDETPSARYTGLALGPFDFTRETHDDQCHVAPAV